MTKHCSFRLTDSGSELSSDSEARFSRAFAFAQQAVILIIAALILDGGHLLRLCAIAAAASWVATAVILLRRRKQPTNVDLAVIKYGFWPAILLVLVLGAVLDRVVL